MKTMIASAVLIVLLAVLAAIQHSEVNYYTVTVESKERISTGTGSSLRHKYLVFTEDKVFENTDTMLRLKFDSSDIQGRLKVGSSYKIKTYGWRINFLSMYENIIGVEDL